MQKNKMDKYIREKVQKDNKIPLKAEKIVENFEEMMLMKENEKRVIGISLKTFIAVAASFIIIAFLGVNIYANKMGKPNVISAVKALFKEEVVDNENEKIEQMLRQAFVDIHYLYHADLTEEYGKDNSAEMKQIGEKTYYKTTSKYSVVEEKYGKMLIDEALKKLLALRFLNVDGNLYVCNMEGEEIETSITDIQRVNEEDGTYTYEIKSVEIVYNKDIEATTWYKVRKVEDTYKICAVSFLQEETQNVVPNEEENTIDVQEQVVDEKENMINQTEDDNQTTNHSNSNSLVSKTLYGDANCDGEVNLKDSVYIRRYVAGWEGYTLTEQGKINADVNMDGKIEEFDASVISEYLAGNYKKLPVKAASTTWVEKNVPGMRLKYPANWNVTEVNRNAWHFQQGELACVFEGETNGYNFKVSIYEPYYDSNVKDFESMLRTIAKKNGEVYNEFYGSTGYNIGSTEPNYLEWREIMRNTNNDNKKMKECYHTWGGWVYRIVIDYDYNSSDPSGFATAYRVIDEMIGSTKLKSY